MTRVSSEPLYTVGVAAQMVGTSPQTLRLYENEGLILAHRTESNQRRYSDVEIAKVRCIQKMIREEGMNFSGLRHLFALIPCWELRDCPEEDHEKCPAFLNRTGPCWAMAEKCLHPLDSCRDCAVYLETTDCSELKDLLFRARRSESERGTGL
ncbi:MAG: MerR family transcriptional regulator [Candidatus Eisenbacteria bacterium]|nr:MerR family transcriptional regulator [Candidatus Eisenbacteria bacterium]